MIEIIAGIIVLILAIIGIAKLVQRRGGDGGEEAKEVSFKDLQATHGKVIKWKNTARAAAYNPGKYLDTLFKYAGDTIRSSKSALSAIYGHREQLKQQVERADARLKNYTEEFDDPAILYGTMKEAAYKLSKGKK